MKFKIGDRVSVADVDRFTDMARPYPEPMNGKGKVTKIFAGGLIQVDMDSWDPPGKNIFNPKQCRPLKKKTRVWLNYCPSTYPGKHRISGKTQSCGFFNAEISSFKEDGFTEYVKVKK